MEAIVLAGGLGTRLREEVKDIPKCMAPVSGKPFLEYVLNYLESQFVDQVILSLGYKHDVVTDWLKTKAFTFKIKWVIEQEPLGTGGGVRRALNKSEQPQVFILNGDTLFKVNLQEMQAASDEFHKAVLALKPMSNFDRYGAVQMDEAKNIIAFEEKQFRETGLINGGVYLLNKRSEDFRAFPDKFSLETDFLERQTGSKSLKGYESDAYFIDIGVPEDYQRAQTELAGR